MIVIPPDLLARFESILTKKSVPNEQRNHYKKWLRYYLDFCQKYKQPISTKESLQQFIKKLQEKNQTPWQQKQASDAVSLYFDLLHTEAASAAGVNPSTPRPEGRGLHSTRTQAEGLRVQPHPFKEIDAASKKYQMVKLTGMMNFHIDPSYVNDLYQKVGLDFANKVIDPAFNDFVKEVVPIYPITEILPKREEIRKRAMMKLGDNLARYHIIVDDIYFANIRFSPEYERAVEAKQVAQQQVETQRQVLAQREIEAQQKVATAKGEAESILVVAQGQAKANDALSRSISPILVQYKSIEKWNGILPQVSGGALPLIDFGKTEGWLGGSKK